MHLFIQPQDFWLHKNLTQSGAGYSLRKVYPHRKWPRVKALDLTCQTLLLSDSGGRVMLFHIGPITQSASWLHHGMRFSDWLTLSVNGSIRNSLKLLSPKTHVSVKCANRLNITEPQWKLKLHKSNSAPGKCLFNFIRAWLIWICGSFWVDTDMKEVKGW